MWKYLAAAIVALVAAPATAQQPKTEGLEGVANMWGFMTIAQECSISAAGTLVCATGPMLQVQGIIAAREWARMSKQYMRSEAEAACIDIADEFLTSGNLREGIVQTFANGLEGLTCIYTNVSIKSEFKSTRQVLGSGQEFDLNSKNKPPAESNKYDASTPTKKLSEIYNSFRTQKEFSVCTISSTFVSCQVASAQSSFNLYDIEALADAHGAEFLDEESPKELCRKLNPGKRVSAFDNDNENLKGIKICIVE